MKLFYDELRLKDVVKKL